jgi:hypothetical protein
MTTMTTTRTTPGALRTETRTNPIEGKRAAATETGVTTCDTVDVLLEARRK